jgi:hypothetical protein
MIIRCNRDLEYIADTDKLNALEIALLESETIHLRCPKCFLKINFQRMMSVWDEEVGLWKSIEVI